MAEFTNTPATRNMFLRVVEDLRERQSVAAALHQGLSEAALLRITSDRLGICQCGAWIGEQHLACREVAGEPREPYRGNWPPADLGATEYASLVLRALRHRLNSCAKWPRVDETIDLLDGAAGVPLQGPTNLAEAVHLAAAYLPATPEGAEPFGLATTLYGYVLPSIVGACACDSLVGRKHNGWCRHEGTFTGQWSSEELPTVLLIVETLEAIAGLRNGVVPDPAAQERIFGICISEAARRRALLGDPNRPGILAANRLTPQLLQLTRERVLALAGPQSVRARDLLRAAARDLRQATPRLLNRTSRAMRFMALYDLPRALITPCLYCGAWPGDLHDLELCTPQAVGLHHGNLTPREFAAAREVSRTFDEIAAAGERGVLGFDESTLALAVNRLEHAAAQATEEATHV